MSKQILTLISVGEKYTNECLPHIQFFLDKGWDVRVLTNTPNQFNNCTTYEYPNKVFSYFDKLLFPLRISEKEKSGVLFIDADEIGNFIHLADVDFTNQTEFMVYDYWRYHYDGMRYIWDTFIQYDDIYFEPLLSYWNSIEFDYSKLKTMWEGVYYYPSLDKTNSVLYDIECIKPIFEYMSIIKSHPYSGIGNGEGLALSYCLHKNNISINETEISNNNRQ